MNREKIAVLIDSGCDVPQEFIKKHGLYVLPLKILFSDGEYYDGITITAQEVYNRLPHEIPKTSLPSGASITKTLDEIKMDGYEKVLVVCISSGLSGTYNLANLICNEYVGLEAFVLDTRNISIASGMLAIQAVEFLENGMGWNELIPAITKKIPDSRVFFCLKTLEYLQKGGRIGLVAAALGGALNIKPIIACNKEGIYYTVSKALGRKASIKKVIELAEKFADGAKKVEIALVNGDAEAEAEEVAANLHSRIKNGIITVRGQISPALSVHTGPGLIGVEILRKN